MKEVYFDNNATTAVAPEVLEAMMPFFKSEYGNPSSMHIIGGRIKQHIDHAREQVAALINADPEEILFTSCGTESNNTALRGSMLAQPGKRHIVTSKVEHPAVLEVAQYLGTRGMRVTELYVDGEGQLNLDDLSDAISDETGIVSIMWANNETGVIFPIQEIAEICAERGVPCHTDAVQAVGKIPIDVQNTPVNMLSLSGHKLHTPKGIGALYVRRKTPLKPFMLGGHQERGRRAGTENVPYIVGLGVAAELATKHMEEENTRVKALRDKLENALLEKCPDTRRNGHKDLRLPNTTNISFEYIEGEAILLLMDAQGIAASSGSACTSGSLEPSHVIRALGVPYTAVHGSTRFSLSRYNTEAEVDYVIEQVPPIIERLRKMSPFVGGEVY